MRDATMSFAVPAQRARTCEHCGDVIHVASSHARVRGSAIATFCSKTCAEESTKAKPEPVALPAVAAFGRTGRLFGTLVVISAGIACLSTWPYMEPSIALHASAPLSDALPTHAAPDDGPLVGPQWPPPDDQLMFAVAGDVWIHPLPGPERRMPLRSSRTFGAERPGSRPLECGWGHCGVDLGGEVWGEPVLAVHDGAVLKVQRNQHSPRGGMYVSLSHHGGAVVTKYFHLAAIPRRIHRGARVRAGDVIGLVGETGVDNSGPHLHFSISVRPEPDAPESYMDPEPLMAIWPLAVASPEGHRYLIATKTQPAVTRGAAHRTARRPRARRGRAHTRQVGQAGPEATADNEQPQ